MFVKFIFGFIIFSCIFGSFPYTPDYEHPKYTITSSPNHSLSRVIFGSCEIIHFLQISKTAPRVIEELFYFFIFLFYGTYDTHTRGYPLDSVEIIQCSHRYSDYMTSEVVKLRGSTLPGELKELTVDEIQAKIHEFYLVIMDGNAVGCFRIFVPDTIPDVLELGSVRSIESGIGTLIAHTAMSIAEGKKKQLVAITGERYTKTLSQIGWIDATDKYPERISGSIQDRKLLIYNKL